MLRIGIISYLSVLCWFLALAFGATASANAVVAIGSACSGSFTGSAAVAATSLAGNRVDFASATVVEPGTPCQNVTGSCDGSPCSSITCTSTSSDGTATSESYAVNPPMSNPGCAGTFCQKKCQ
jgi:hypothetical protein